ncbi:hypothetical protein BG004_001439 [Podila humilis]|nr:hypothetical protein BG004_001439 [Podila humilis]
MTLVRTNTAEFSDLFIKFFEDSPREIEKLPNVPFPLDKCESPVTFSNAIGATKHIDLLPTAFPEICNTVVAEFFGHCRNKDDYSIQSVRLLRNPVTWRRYQAEKKLRRQIADQEWKIKQHPNIFSTTVSNKVLSPPWRSPESMFRDEILFHGTPARKIPSILQNGLDPRTTVRANYGKGVYFSDSIEKCMQYVDVQTSMEQEYTIILCCVILGKVWVEPHAKTYRSLNTSTVFLPEGYDSAVGHDSFKEWIVYEKSQTLPLCAINFKASNRPDCFHRLSTYSVLFQGQGHYPASMTLIQTSCNVPTPSDKNSRATPSTVDWKDNEQGFVPADAAMSKMLEIVFNIPSGSAQVRRIQFHQNMEWVVTAKNQEDRTVYFYLDGFKWDLLLGLSKNIEKLQLRQEEDKSQSLLARNNRQRRLEQSIQSIPECEALIARYMALKPELDDLEAQGVAVKQFITVLQSQYPNKDHEYLVKVHPYELQHKYLEQQYISKVASVGPMWNQDHVQKAIQIMQERSQLQMDTAQEVARLQRQLEAINAEKQKAYQQAVAYSNIVTLTQLEDRILMAKNSRAAAALKIIPFSADFALWSTTVNTYNATIWAQVVAELLMPTIMIAQAPTDTYNFLNNTNRDELEQMAGKPLIKGVVHWFELASLCLFYTDMASPAFWPVSPHNKLPNRRLFMMKDYIEWMFLEKEHRVRAAAQLKARPGMLSRLVQDSQKMDEDPLKDVDVEALYAREWGRLDPCILKALKGLKSRHGTVEFNRKERQEELDKLGKDLMSDLLVVAEPEMLRLDQSSHTTSSSTSSSSTTALTSNSSTTSTTTTTTTTISTSVSVTAAPSTLTPSPDFSAECSICRDELAISKAGTSAAAASEPDDQVVKLNACRHCFHRGCIVEWFLSPNSQLKCPVCNTLCTTRGPASATKEAFKGSVTKLGPMPNGYMGYTFDDRLACFFIYIVMPGHTIRCDSTGLDVLVPPDRRYAVVPLSAKLGPLLMIRLICLFYYGHMFRVGESVTRGLNNVLVWNGVHLRTAMTGSYGFPAPEAELSCWEEINRKGVAMGLDELILDIPPMLSSEETRSVETEVEEETAEELQEEIDEDLTAQGRIQYIMDPDSPSLFSLTEIGRIVEQG